jgi:hypothetical protein
MPSVSNAQVSMNAPIMASPARLDPAPDFESVNIAAPATPIKTATMRSTAKRSRKNMLARTAASGGNRLNNRTACPALVS